MRRAPAAGADEASRPNVTLFWSQVFHTNRATDIVLDDAAIALYQELTGRTISLSDYYDRSYNDDYYREPRPVGAVRASDSHERGPVGGGGG